MDLNKVLNELKTIENHAERLVRIENLIEKILESNQRSEKHLENMWRLYEEMAAAQQAQQRR